MKVTADGQPWFEGRAACVLVGNVGRILGGVEVFPTPASTTASSTSASSRPSPASTGCAPACGRCLAGSTRSLVQITQAATAKIRLDRTMPWELDGAQSRTKKLDVSVQPGRAPILVPAS